MTIIDLHDGAEGIGECDCCGRQGVLTKTVIYGIDTSACDLCRGQCDQETRAAAIARYTAEITVLQEARATCRTLWCKALLTGAIADVRRKIDDIKEGFV